MVQRVRQWGLDCPEAEVVADGADVAVALRRAVAEGVALVLTTGGTGLSPRDQTPEVTLALLDRPAPGIAEAIRAHGVSHGVAAAMLSRGVAGLSGGTLVVNLPGSTGGVRDALDVLDAVVAHALDQIAGSDHR